MAGFLMLSTLFLCNRIVVVNVFITGITHQPAAPLSDSLSAINLLTRSLLHVTGCGSYSTLQVGRPSATVHASTAVSPVWCPAQSGSSG